MFPAFKWPAFIDRGGRGYYVGRDLRGHFVKPDGIEEPCTHPCCAGLAKPVSLAERRDRKSAGKSSAKRRQPAGRHRVPPRDGFGVTTYQRESGPASSSATERRAAGRRAGRVSFDGYLHSHFLDAEGATHGYMVTKEAKARGITGADFFKPGRRPSVERWGSDELKAWFRKGDSGTRRILSARDYAAQSKAA